ncbi:MAG: M20/M25/M40 family metallo-hydrolase [Verrucomicrobiae bacterium]|nr:M20/M25/M40 family metallo-hydrolase [Verrucomicrobiae bacterium]
MSPRPIAFPTLKTTDNEFAEAVATLKALLRFDTTNPPGNEGPAAEFLARKFRDAGLTPELAGAEPRRPNLVCKLPADPSRKCGRPLVLSCHLDVVPADPARWTHPPFDAVEADGCVWGRGAIDMKGFATLAAMTVLAIRRRGLPLNRDLIFVAVADEEAGAELGSQWLVENRPDLLGNDPEYIVNEVGGFTLPLDGKRFYPVQVAEKGVAWLRLTVRGTPGHSSLPSEDNALGQLGEAMARIARARLPWHVSEPARDFLGGIARESGPLKRLFSPLLLHPLTGPALLDRAIADPARRASVEAVLRNTANPTVARGGSKINVLPGSASVDIDGRLAPGQTAADLVRELRAVLGDPTGGRFDFEVLRESEAVAFPPDTPFFEAIRAAVKRHDPEGIVVPAIVPGFTDSKNYARLGAVCYGFYPLQLPEDLNFAALFHGDDERIPLDGFRWGLETLLDLVVDFAGA